jgi:uncharacterized protein YbjT (DUF2867 family)
VDGPKTRKPRVLLTGASGYVGGSLIKPLEERGYPLRCVVRNPDRLRGRISPSTQVIAGDVYDIHSLAKALDGVDVAFYLLHSMELKKNWQQMERRAARNFAGACLASGVSRIIYLGGLGSGEDLSDHLASRHEVGRILRTSGVPTIEFRASIIIGAGSLSFEMISALVDRLPVMLMPRWVRMEAQPIDIKDVIEYLIKAIEADVELNTCYDIGGRERASYVEIMKEYARQRGLTRLMIPVPLLTPWLSSLWLGLVTPLFARVGRKLVESVYHDTVVHDDRAREIFQVNPCGIRESIERALVQQELSISRPSG